MKNGAENALPTPGGGNGKSWQLSLYDQHRIPHDPITDSTEITVSPRSLNSELMCPICLDMLKSTMTTKECLHRFCQECITTALRSGNKECPTCRKKLISKRSLRPDPNFDALISKLYPDRKEYEAMQERALARLSKHYNTEALQKSIEEGMRVQAQLRKMHRVSNLGGGASSTPQQDDGGGGNGEKRTKKRRREDNSRRQTPDRESSVGDQSTSDASATQVSKNRASEVELVLKPHPDIVRSSAVHSVIKQTRYLKTTANASMDHLARYLSIRIKLDADEAMRNNMESSLDAFEKMKPLLSSTSTASPAPADPSIAPPVQSMEIDQKSEEIVKPSEQQSIDQPQSQSSSASTGDMPRIDPNSSSAEKEEYKVYVEQNGNPNQLVQLAGNLNLETVVGKYWTSKRPLELLFLIPDSILAGLMVEKTNSTTSVVGAIGQSSSGVASSSTSKDENSKPTLMTMKMDGGETAVESKASSG